jgi:hypothetical protein
VPRRRKAHRSRPDLHAREVAGEKRVLCLAVPVVDREAEGVLERPDHLGIERLSSGDEVPDPGEVVAL